MRNKRKFSIALLGLLCVTIGPWFSTIGTTAVVAEETSDSFLLAKSPVLFRLTLLLGDVISVDLAAESAPVEINVIFLNYVVARSPQLSGGTWSWTANGNANYTLSVSPVVTGVVALSYKTTRFASHFPWATPVGLVSGIVLLAVTSLKIESLRSGAKIRKISWRSREVMLVFAIFAMALSVRMYPLSPMIHNDELGMGITANWGYFAWGYVDTVRQVTTISRESPFSYQAWAMVLNQGKPIVAVLLMSVPSLVTGSSDFLFLSRFVVEIAGAITAVLMFFLLQRLFGRIAGLLSGGLSAFDPLLLNYSRSAYPDVPSLMFQVLTILFLLQFRETGRPQKAILSGLALGLAGATKSLLIIGAFLPIVLVILFSPRRTKLELITNLGIITATSIAVFWVAWPALWVISPSTIGLSGVHLSVSPALGARSPQIQDTILYLGAIRTLPIYERPIVDLILQTSYVEVAGFVVALTLSRRWISVSYSKFRGTLLLVWFGTMFLGSEFFYVNQHDLLYLVVPYVAVCAVGLSFLVKKLENSLLAKESQTLGRA